MGKVEFGVALCEAASQNDLGKIRQRLVVDESERAQA